MSHTFANKSSLPIDDIRRSILYKLQDHQILIISAQTGSGKSSRIPQILYRSGLFDGLSEAKSDPQRPRMIGITQQRRLAATQLAQRVSDELNCNLGTLVGYAVRFHDSVDPEQTLIKYMTEGLLIREMMQDPLLSNYSVIMVDEVHERNLNTDLLLGLMKCVLLKRQDLRLIICSATIDIEGINKFFISGTNDGLKLAVLHCEGVVYPLSIHYMKEPVANYLEATIDTVIKIHEDQRLSSGSILAFLTGRDEVEYACERLEDYAQTCSARLDVRKLRVLPLHASLRKEEVSRVFESHGKTTRVCVVATNVAETSLTIDHVAHVIDCGFVKTKFFDHKTGVDHLTRVPVSKAAANQRAGRAGRTRKGFVYRLYTQTAYEDLRDETVPDIQKSSLLEPLMLLKSLGIENPMAFPLLSPMPRDSVAHALELMFALGAIDNTGSLTQVGQDMAGMSVEPKLAKILVSDAAASCVQDLCKIVSMLQVKEIYAKRACGTRELWSNELLTKICVSDGDLLSYLNIFNAFVQNNKAQKWAERRSLNYDALINATEIAVRLERHLRKLGYRIAASKSSHMEPILKSVANGLFANAAYLHPNGDYKTVRGDLVVHVHPTSVYFDIVDRPKLVLFVEIINTTKTYMRHITPVQQDWLLQSAPHYYAFATELEMSRRRRRL